VENLEKVFLMVGRLLENLLNLMWGGGGHRNYLIIYFKDEGRPRKMFQDDRSQDLPDTRRISVSSRENNMEVPLRLPQHACCCSLIIKCVTYRAHCVRNL